MSDFQGDKHTAILDAAFALFGSQGFYDAKISDIADLAGIAKGTVYLYFKSKEKLFAAVSERDFSDFLNRLHEGLKRGASLQEQLQFIARHHLEYYYARKDHTKLFFMAPNNDPELMGLMQNFLRSYMAAVCEVLSKADVPEPMLHAKAYIGMLDQLKMDILFDRSLTEGDLNKNIHFVSRLFIYGCPVQEQDGTAL
ncbi:TetR/AcrR family transcriptional regulator [Paenibacillus sp. YPG26]|uniref:TetR/AcrR family transcriptional regulator n=1 Tax=Paenibacillus sp. YPG26 TaxID=2878915 RepID=UPI00203BF129|nr:TetR/AcrR family transcriptional regulator [Paenibacillus sp. YPG26]USB32255.1 TetR/AcrR family transcriptional regulator [Paenibacillus sp. YPG26]